MEELTQYIKADFAVLVAGLYCIGRGLKAIQRCKSRCLLLYLGCARWAEEGCEAAAHRRRGRQT